MILFRCPACGTAHRADPQYAGGMIPCRHCAKQVPIPHESDPACALVYKAGEAEDGLPMTTDEIRAKLLSGELAETDLVWDNSTWKPLAQAYGAIKEGEGGLRLKRREEPAKSEQELQAPLMSLNAVQKVDLSEIPAEPVTETKKRRFQLVRRHETKEEKPPESLPAPPAVQAPVPAVEPPQAPKEELSAEKVKTPETPKEPEITKPPEAPKAPAKPQKPRGRLYYLTQGLLLIVAVVGGCKFGVGPLISQFRDKPSYIIVQNHEDIEYTLALGWRHAKEDLYKHSLVNYEIWVGMPERQVLSVTPKIPGTAQAFSLKVPVRPGSVTLVNLKALGEYGIYDLSAVTGKTLGTPELKALTAEIGSNRSPDSAVKVSRQIRDLVAPAFKGTKQDMLFRSSQYDFDQGMLYRMRDRLLARSEKKKKEEAKAKASGTEVKAPKPPAPKLLVTFPAARTLSFVNGSALYSPTEREKVDRSVVLPLSTLNLSANRIIKVQSPRLLMTGDDKSLSLVVQMPNATVNVDGRNFTGQWEYRANAALAGKDANRWRWNWTFRGFGEGGGKRFSLELKVEADGKESRTVKPVE